MSIKNARQIIDNLDTTMKRHSTRNSQIHGWLNYEKVEPTLNCIVRELKDFGNEQEASEIAIKIQSALEFTPFQDYNIWAKVQDPAWAPQDYCMISSGDEIPVMVDTPKEKIESYLLVTKPVDAVIVSHPDKDGEDELVVVPRPMRVLPVMVPRPSGEEDWDMMDDA